MKRIVRRIRENGEPLSKIERQEVTYYQASSAQNVVLSMKG